MKLPDWITRTMEETDYASNVNYQDARYLAALDSADLHNDSDLDTFNG